MTDLTNPLIAALQPLTSRVRTDVTAKRTPDGKSCWTSDPLTVDHLARHLNGGPARGVCPIKEGESVTMVGLLDFDSHKGETPWPQMCLTVGMVAEAMALAYGLEPVVFRSTGGKGVHLYVMWDAPQDAHSVRCLLGDVLKGVGLRSGTGGVSSGAVEVFPKQSSVGMGRFGNQFILPLAGASELLEFDDLSGGYVGVGKVAPSWAMSADVPQVERAERVAQTLGGGMGADGDRSTWPEWRHVLADPRYRTEGREEWRNTLYAIHYESNDSDEGFSLAVDWAHADNTDGRWGTAAEVEDAVAKVWNGARTDQERMITGGFIVTTARRLFGWVSSTELGAVPEDEAAEVVGDLKEDNTDAGHVNVLVRLAAGRLRYVWALDKWFWYNTAAQRWVRDDSREHTRTESLRVAEVYEQKAEALKRSYAARWAEMSGAEQKEAAKQIQSAVNHASSCKNKRVLDPLCSEAQKDGRVLLGHDEIDANRWVLGVPNGVVDLRTGRLRNGAMSEFVTLSAAVPFDPNARAPRWEQFVDEIMGVPIPGSHGYVPRPEMVAHIQRTLGYMLTGETREQKMFIATGVGSNGKSVLFDTVRAVMGNYATSLDPKHLEVSKRNGDAESASPSIARLRGARLVLCNEPLRSSALDTSKIKKHTGDATLSARSLHENTLDFTVTHKLCMLTNAMPSLDHDDSAIHGRLSLFNFEMRWNRPDDGDYSPDRPDADKDLITKLTAEYPGILAWLVRGAVAYHAEGRLSPPPCVTEGTKAYYQEQDVFGQWLKTLLDCEFSQGALASTLFSNFIEWRRETGQRGGPDSSIAFGREMSKRGYQPKRVAAGMSYPLAMSPTASGGALLGAIADDGIADATPLH